MSVLLGYLLANIFRKNPLNEYLNFFKSSVKSQQMVESKIYLLTQINTMFNWSLFLFPLLITGLFFVVNSFFFEQELSWVNFSTLLKNEKSNSQLLIIFLVGIFSLFILKKICLVIRRSYVEKLQVLNENKQVCVQKFFNFIGEEMKEQIKNFLIENTHEEIKRENVIKK